MTATAIPAIAAPDNPAPAAVALRFPLTVLVGGVASGLVMVGVVVAVVVVVLDVSVVVVAVVVVVRGMALSVDVDFGVIIVTRGGILGVVVVVVAVAPVLINRQRTVQGEDYYTLLTQVVMVGVAACCNKL